MRRLLVVLMISVAFSNHGIEQIFAAPKRYIEITKEYANIHISPSSSSELIAKAESGSVFRFSREEGDWYGIFMFSGERRYVHKSHAKIISFAMVVPKSETLRKSAFKEIYAVEGRAMKEADQKYPMSGRYGRPIKEKMMKNIDHQRILDDRYKLQIFNKYKIQPALYNKIAVEGVKKKWHR